MSELPARPASTFRPGQRTILLSVANGGYASLLLAFTRTRGGIAFWRSSSPEKSPLEHVATFPGPFGVRAVAGLLASGAAGPAVTEHAAEEAWIDGVEVDDADLLRLAWHRVDGRVDRRAMAVLGLPSKTLDWARECAEPAGVQGLLELGQDILDSNRAWVEKHRADVDAEVDRRTSGTAAGEQERRAIRAFVEECLVVLGRLPRPDETAERWDGLGLAGRDIGAREQRRLGLHQTGRAGKFSVWVHYWDGAGAIGRGEFGSGAGWYWDVNNPDPGWVMSGTMGPYDSAAEAWSDASTLAEQE